MAKITTLKECWYSYYTGEKYKRKHTLMKLVCAECGCAWDTQGYAFRYCPGCGRCVMGIEKVENDG